jgi:hypothetical protein
MTVYLVISLPKILYIYGSGQPILGDIHRVGQNRLYIYTVYYHIFGDFPAKIPYVYGSGQPTLSDIGLAKPYIHTVYDRVFGDFPAKYTVDTPYIYGSGQPTLSDIHWRLSTNAVLFSSWVH